MIVLSKKSGLTKFVFNRFRALNQQLE